MPETFDILVIGGGPAGYSAAIFARRRLLQHDPESTVGLIEADKLGGTCLNRGCIPTKTLIETARLLDMIAEAPARGVDVPGPATINLANTFRNKDRIVKRMTAGVGVLLRDNGVVSLSGTAALERSADKVFPFAVNIRDSKTGDLRSLAAKKVILASGSLPARVPVEGLDDPAVAPFLLTSDEMLDAEKMPDELKERVPPRLAILGGGVIGIEMARIFKAFGSDVHLIEALPRLAPFLDGELSAALTKTLSAKKIGITVDRKLRRVEPANGGLTLHLEGGETIDASHLLLAVGRRPNTDLLSAELLGELQPRQGGFLPVDWKMRTRVPGLFAPGDVNGRCMLAHAAIEMGHLAAEWAVDELYPEAELTDDETGESFLEEFRRRIMEKEDGNTLPDLQEGFFPFYVPACIYGEPEIGTIGWTEEKARQELGDRIRVGRFPFAANGRAASSGHRDGFVKVLSLEDEQRIVGVHIVGPCASELINEVSAILYAGGNIDQWTASVHAHPTYGEALVEAAADSLGQALHLPPK